ncbi:ferric reductase like transmembrane component-domain-containing protein [Mycena belliarum]|uniref:ferric-chelate reductase (NADPH) n=1 Tax=Mycena belliarum TaxID=1033014 RepID=A0AAD6TWV7_9AGAR|nr:ferric reductase like transmembrane component-domain-containing protein [Mycena belliae]
MESSTHSNHTLVLSVAAKLKAVNPDKAPSIHRGHEYPLQIWYLLASFIALISIIHFAAQLSARLRTPHAPGRRKVPTLRRLPAAVLHVFRTTAFRITVSRGSYTLNLTEFFLGCAYMAVIFTWAFINTTNLAGERFAPRYYANRSGFIAATQFPLLIALGMKNNIITFLTGVGFDKLNLLHRIVARVLCVLLWIHGGGRVSSDGNAHSGKVKTLKNFEEGWFRWGVVSATALTLLCFLSVRPLRNRGYEMFLVAHFFVALILLVGSYIHTTDTNETQYIWPSFIIWGLDRFVRFVRIFLVNGGYLNLLGKKTQAHPLNAQVDIISPSLLRMRLFLPDRFSWRPGQVAYLSVPCVSSTPWQAHPFSIASIDAGSGGSASRAESTASSEDEKCASAGGDALAVPTPGHAKELVFFLRVHKGFTKRLLDAATTSGGTATFPVYVDGPYGSPPSARGFGTVLLVAGGSGMAFTLPLLLDLIRGHKTGTNPTCSRVLFVWIIRDREHITAISDILCQALDGLDPKSLGIEIQIHVTTSVDGMDCDEASAATDMEKGGDAATRRLLGFPYIRVCEGRPDVDEIVRTEIGAATGDMSVDVCGARTLTEHVQRALRGATSGADVLRGGPSVRLHVEAFGGA